ncbi:unnamed protein product [Strongylus vulgaris]|uniref:Uncharacterized protein n=1 Tax=Strongylus vulgaris TaxID=40348 RepID=A0A3P7ISX5_STRVU|nr:unnamed protein product [Strongylus vulgaris]
MSPLAELDVELFMYPLPYYVMNASRQINSLRDTLAACHMTANRVWLKVRVLSRRI